MVRLFCETHRKSVRFRVRGGLSAEVFLSFVGLTVPKEYICNIYIRSFNVYNNLHQLAEHNGVNVEAWMPFCPQCGGPFLLWIGSSVHRFIS